MIDDALPTAPDLFGDEPPGGSVAPAARPRAWFLGDAPAPEEEPEDEAGRAAMAADAAQLPFLQVVRHLLEFIGDGCRTTKLGALYVVDRRRIEELCADSSDGWSWRPHGTDQRVQHAWLVLLRHGWLAREDGWVWPTGKPLLGVGPDALTAQGLEGTRRLLAAALGSDSPEGRSVPGTEMTDDVLDALLVAAGPDGLTLPDPPRDGRLIHCFESVDFLVGLIHHPHVRDVPLDRGSGHIADSALHRLALTVGAMEHLDRGGLVTVQGEEGVDDPGEDWHQDWYAMGTSDRESARIYRAPVLMRGAIALVRESRPAAAGVLVPPF